MILGHSKKDTVSRLKEIDCPTPAEGKWLVYILECMDGTLYCGCTNNLVRRLKEHNLGQAARRTRGRGPVKLIYFESYGSLLAARSREALIKSWSLPRKIKLILGA